MPMDVIRHMAAEILGADDADISRRTGFYGKMDVVSVARLVMACERRYRLTIPDERVPDMRCLGDLNQYIGELLEAGENRRTPVTERERTQWFYD